MAEIRTKRTPLALERREVLALGVGVFVAASIPWAARAPRRIVRRRIPSMGTIAEVAVVHDDRRLARAATEAAFDALRNTDRLMSRFRRDSDVGRANRLAARSSVTISAETADVLLRALEWARVTDGAFDPCLGRASRLWDVKRRQAPPSAEQVRPLAARGLWQALEVERSADAGRVYFRDGDVAIDLGGIAKGHGVDMAVAALRAHGVRDGLVNVGGDLYALGCSVDGDAWQVGVRDAQDPERLVRTLALSDGAVATSGDYQQFFEHGGTRYHHLLDPQTGAPVRARARSVTVERATCLDADAAATATFTQPA